MKHAIKMRILAFLILFSCLGCQESVKPGNDGVLIQKSNLRTKQKVGSLLPERVKTFLKKKQNRKQLRRRLQLAHKRQFKKRKKKIDKMRKKMLQQAKRFRNKLKRLKRKGRNNR